MRRPALSARFLIILLATAGAAACGGTAGGPSTPTGPGAPTADHIAMSQPTATIHVGDHVTLSATAIATDGSTLAATFA